MCGFVGFWNDRLINREAALFRMSAALRHRGPDDHGAWFDENTGFCFAHRRLAIQDLSSEGCQPMRSLDSRFVIVFNGEIYNHILLRKDLERNGWGFGWRGKSDTETLLAAIQTWGVIEALKKLVGMFSFALWDLKKKSVFLARDRLGEKPLYYGWAGNTFLFGSELKSIALHPGFNFKVDRRALSVFLRHNYIPSPYCIYEGFKKLPSGSYLEITSDEPFLSSAPVSYWSANECIERGLLSSFSGSDVQAVEALDRTLSLSVKSQMLSDVPIGSFLSGGIDSSLITALMQQHSESAINTFSIGFDDASFNEAQHAAAISKYLGTDHTELYLSGADSINVVPKLKDIFSEPFADSSQIPMYLISQMASQRIKVALSGDGADELFGGYSTYLFAPKYWRYLSAFPQPLRRLLSKPMSSLCVSNRISKLAQVLRATNQEDFYRRVISHWEDPDSVVIDGNEYNTIVSSASEWPVADSYQQWMMAMESQMYLPDDILVKLDRTAMANSLETRVPMLDHRVVEFAWSLPLHMKIRDGKGKWILRQLLYKYVPKSLVDRPKKGFSVPLHSWLRGPLRPWAESLLSEGLMRDQGYFNSKVVRNAWQQHLSGRKDNSHCLWSVLMFQAWLEGQHE